MPSPDDDHAALPRSQPQPSVHRQHGPGDERGRREHSHATGPATSAGSPSRPSAVAASSRSRCSPASTSVSRVVTYPGATAFTRTPAGPASRARLRTRPTMPALEAA